MQKVNYHMTRLMNINLLLMIQKWLIKANNSNKNNNLKCSRLALAKTLINLHLSKMMNGIKLNNRTNKLTLNLEIWILILH